MASEVDICNMALGHFGQDANISSINPADGSAEADLCARFYPMLRDEMLEEYDWTFARRYDTLTRVTNDRTDWAYKYALPASYLKARRVLPSGWTDPLKDAVEYEVVGTALYTDEVLATLVHTYKLTDTTKFSAKFTLGLSFRVGSVICGPIVKDTTGALQRSLRTASDAEVEQAKAIDANSERTRVAYTPTAKQVR